MYSFLGEDPSEAVELCCLNLMKTYSEFLYYKTTTPANKQKMSYPTHLPCIHSSLDVLSKSLANSMRDSESGMEEGNLVTKSCFM